MGQHYWHERTLLQTTLRFYVNRHGSWLCQVAWCSTHITECMVNISRKSVSLRTNITSSTRVHFRRLSHTAVQKWLQSTVNSNQWKHPRRSKHYFDCWWPSKSRAASECIEVVDLEDLIENGQLTAHKSGIRLFYPRTALTFAPALPPTIIQQMHWTRGGRAYVSIIAQENLCKEKNVFN